MTHDFSSGSASPQEQEQTALVVEESKSFAEFDHAMDEQLERLVALWIHTAAPNASRVSRVQKMLNR
jgi:hypothetical protein